MAYQLAWEPQGVLVNFSGKATNWDFLSAMLKGFGHSNFDTLRYVIADCLRMEECHFNDGAIQDLIVQSIGAMQTNAHIAVAVVAIDEKAVKLAKLYQSAWTYPTEIFSTLEGARAWLKDFTVDRGSKL